MTVNDYEPQWPLCCVISRKVVVFGANSSLYVKRTVASRPIVSATNSREKDSSLWQYMIRDGEWARFSPIFSP